MKRYKRILLNVGKLAPFNKDLFEMDDCNGTAEFVIVAQQES